MDQNKDSALFNAVEKTLISKLETLNFERDCSLSSSLTARQFMTLAEKDYEALVNVVSSITEVFEHKKQCLMKKIEEKENRAKEVQELLRLSRTVVDSIIKVDQISENLNDSKFDFLQKPAVVTKKTQPSVVPVVEEKQKVEGSSSKRPVFTSNYGKLMMSDRKTTENESVLKTIENVQVASPVKTEPEEFIIPPIRKLNFDMTLGDETIMEPKTTPSVKEKDQEPKPLSRPVFSSSFAKSHW